MQCVRCGYCCQNLFITVVRDPELADAKGITEDNLMVIGLCGVPDRCPHLVGDKVGEYSCAIHDRPWYPETPCARHVQIEQHDSVCRMGGYQLEAEADKKGD